MAIIFSCGKDGRGAPSGSIKTPRPFFRVPLYFITICFANDLSQ